MQIILLILAFLFNGAHELHLSMSNIVFNKEHHRVEIQSRIFYDDLEKSLRLSLNDDHFNILQPELSHLDYDSLLQVYCNKSLDLEINGNDIELSLLEYEIQDDAIVFYLFKKEISEIKTLKIFSNYLFDIFDDQDNVVSVNISHKRKSKKFSYNSKPLEISLE